MSGYTKLFNSILASTVWQEDHETRLVWITMLALADANGYVAAAAPGLAHLARVPLSAVERALESFLGPDPHSRSKEHEGRRIAPVDGGWKLLNHAKYRAMLDSDRRREQNAASMRRSRAKQKSAKRREVESFDSACDNLAPDHVYDEIDEAP